MGINKNVLGLYRSTVPKIIDNNILNSFYDIGDDIDFPTVNVPWLSRNVPKIQSYGIYISQLVRFARACTSVLDFHSNM